MIDTSSPLDRDLRVVVADDEPLARRGLELLLATIPGVRVVEQVGNGAAVVSAVSAHQPDLLLLDIEMPGMSGFDALAAIPAQQMPIVVFVTAFGHYAIQAFDANALDYLLKPVDAARLHRAVGKARTALHQRDADDHRARLLGLLAVASGRPALTLQDALETPPVALRDRNAVLTLRDGTRTVRLDPQRIRWIDAAGDYASVHMDGQTHLVRTTLIELERRLDPERFVRIHRSTIVNAARVRSLRPLRNGESALTLDCGQALKLSRSYRSRLAMFDRHDA
ncbi:MAG TPA: LytTR family DNA-binding domain-containing protein [Luteitalea sp.]|nr:LytTR family DNA-binding domain-containing protein [Luteitalea sp.]